MPIYTEEQKTRMLNEMGADPLRYDIDENDTIIRRRSFSPITISSGATDVIQAKPKTATFTEGLWSGIKQNIGGTVGAGLGTGALVASGLLSGVGTIPTILALGGVGAVSALAGTKGQDILEKSVMSPEDYNNLINERVRISQEAPWGTKAGMAADMLLQGRPSISGLKNLAGAVKQGAMMGGKSLQKAPGVAVSRLTAAQQEAVRNAAIGAATSGATTAGQELITEGTVHPLSVLESAGLGATFTKPFLLGKTKLFGGPGRTVEEAKGPKVEIPKQKELQAEGGKIEGTPEEIANLDVAKTKFELNLENEATKEAKKNAEMLEESQGKPSTPEAIFAASRIIKPRLRAKAEEMVPASTIEGIQDPSKLTMDDFTGTFKKANKKTGELEDIGDFIRMEGENVVSKVGDIEQRTNIGDVYFKKSTPEVARIKTRNIEKHFKKVLEFQQASELKRNQEVVEQAQRYEKLRADLAKEREARETTERVAAESARLAQMGKTTPPVKAEPTLSQLSDLQKSAQLGLLNKMEMKGKLSPEEIAKQKEEYTKIREDARRAAEFGVEPSLEGKIKVVPNLKNEKGESITAELRPEDVRFTAGFPSEAVFHEKTHARFDKIAGSLYEWLKFHGNETTKAVINRADELVLSPTEEANLIKLYSTKTPTGELVLNKELYRREKTAYVIGKKTMELKAAQQAGKIRALKKWWQDFISSVKTDFGKGTSDDVANTLTRLVNDFPNYWESGAAQLDLSAIAHPERKALALKLRENIRARELKKTPVVKKEEEKKEGAPKKAEGEKMEMRGRIEGEGEEEGYGEDYAEKVPTPPKEVVVKPKEESDQQAFAEMRGTIEKPTMEIEEPPDTTIYQKDKSTFLDFPFQGKPQPKKSLTDYEQRYQKLLGHYNASRDPISGEVKMLKEELQELKEIEQILQAPRTQEGFKKVPFENILDVYRKTGEWPKREIVESDLRSRGQEWDDLPELIKEAITTPQRGELLQRLNDARSPLDKVNAQRELIYRDTLDQTLSRENFRSTYVNPELRLLEGNKPPRAVGGLYEPSIDRISARPARPWTVQHESLHRINEFNKERISDVLRYVDSKASSAELSRLLHEAATELKVIDPDSYALLRDTEYPRYLKDKDYEAAFNIFNEAVAMGASSHIDRQLIDTADKLANLVLGEKYLKLHNELKKIHLGRPSEVSPGYDFQTGTYYMRGPLDFMHPPMERLRKEYPEVHVAINEAYNSYRKFSGLYVEDPLYQMYKLAGRASNLKDWWSGRTKVTDEAWEYLNARQDGEDLPVISEKAQEMVRLWDELVSAPVVEETRLRPDTTIREIHPTGEYFPQFIDQVYLRELIQNPRSEESQQIKEDLIEYWRAKGDKDPEGIFKGIMAAFRDPTPVNVGKYFGPLDKAAGLGIPKQYRDPSFLSVVKRYGTRVARRLAYEDNIAQADAETKATMDEISSIDYYKDIISEIAGMRTYTEPGLNAASRVVRATMMMAPTGAVDFISSHFIPMKHMNLLQSPISVINSYRHFTENWKETFKMGVNRQNIVNIEVGEPEIEAISGLTRIAEGVQKLSGRDFFEKAARTNTYGIGKWLAQDNARAMLRGKATNMQKKFLEDFFPGDIEQLASREITPEEVMEAAARFTEINQGTYDFRELPSWAVNSSLAPVFSLARWNIGQWNRFRDYVVKPAKEGNPWPLVMATAGAILGGEAVTWLREQMMGRKMKFPRWEEIKYAKEKGYNYGDDLAYRVAGLAAMSGFAGIMGDLTKMTFDGLKGNYMQTYQNVLLDSASQNWRLLMDVKDALANGDEVEFLDVLSKLAESNIQNYRLLLSHASGVKQEDIERANKLRDLRAFRQLAGRPTSSVGSLPPANYFLGKDVREFKREEDIYEAARMVPDLLKKAVERSRFEGVVDTELLVKNLRRLKSMPTQDFPSPRESPREFMDYREFLRATQGEQAEEERRRDYFKRYAVNRAKAAMIP